MSPFVLPPPRLVDPAAFGRVAVLLGGSSSEREVSLQSGANVLEALRASGIDAHAVDGVDALLEALREGRGYARVFNILHGGVGENGVLQGLLQVLRIPCTGSGVLGSAHSMDKTRTKQVWQSLGLPTPRYLRLHAGAADRAQRVREAAYQLGLPVIVKPANEGSSVGITRVFSDSELDAAVELAARYDGELLMEQLIQGDELTVAILGDVALPSIRIVPKGDWYDYHAKYVAEDTRYLCPGLEGADEEAIGRLALAAFAAVGCQGWGRVDVMRDRASGEFRLLEVNTAPGMTSHSLVPKAAQQAGVSMQALCWRILEATVAEGAA